MFNMGRVGNYRRMCWTQHKELFFYPPCETSGQARNPFFKYSTIYPACLVCFTWTRGTANAFKAAKTVWIFFTSLEISYQLILAADIPVSLILLFLSPSQKCVNKDLMIINNVQLFFPGYPRFHRPIWSLKIYVFFVKTSFFL